LPFSFFFFLPSRQVFLNFRRSFFFFFFFLFSEKNKKTKTGKQGKMSLKSGITTVPGSKELIDIILSHTQRKTPTVVHKGYKLQRIRDFYIRKVKVTQQECHERLTKILEEFPRLDEVHPFYADLINVLYDRDHYKLALGRLAAARHLIDKICRDYVILLKYADILYRCKQLKRAALGRMATLLKQQNASLAYLEQVRQHIARLPSIDPAARTLLLTGFPNVGKSSFMNKVRFFPSLLPSIINYELFFLFFSPFFIQSNLLIPTPSPPPPSFFLSRLLVPTWTFNRTLSLPRVFLLVTQITSICVIR